MGSEHYCLRWNNHQSNLLGVFSQLLQDESLVDVTLACSEGASIRAHKVVLSACSSYFQSLFLDHPDRYPIVVLKDVRFAELRTLVEFMYKGEVNVQYCQLSALLKTAESLKVKGLAEMTNQNTPLQHDTDHEPSERLRSSSAQHHLHHHHQQQLHTQTSVDHELSTSKQQRLANSEYSPSPPTRQSHHQRSSISPPPTLSATTTTSGSYYNISRKNHRGSGENHMNLHHHDTSGGAIKTESSTGGRSSVGGGSEGDGDGGGRSASISVISGNCDENLNNDEPMVTNDTKLRLHSPNDERMSIKKDGEIGLNMTLSAQPIPNSTPSQTPSTIIPPTNSTQTSTSLSDQRPSSRSVVSIMGPNTSGNNGGSGTCGNSVSDRLNRGNLGSPNIQQHEPIPGPSGIREPMQHEPLSLKKEVDWGDRDDKSPGECSLSEYRHQHDVEGTDRGSGSGSGIGSDGGRSPIDGLNSIGGPVYPCMYCGATFPHQSKLTRHILSHSLETLKYREPHLINPNIFNLPPPPHPDFGMHPVSVATSPMFQRPDKMEPPDGSSPMDIDFAAAAAAAAAVQGNSVNSEQGNVVLCKFCGKSFPDVQSLIAHLPVHTGDRPFKCEFCGKAFKLRHHMKDHCRVHTGERPFRCSMCGKTFSRSTILKAHEKTHYPKYVRKFLSPSPVDTKDEPQ